ncbi:MAG TPA: sulfite exporter TauE/SafE family protein, partial [Chryseolinea sp.]
MEIIGYIALIGIGMVLALTGGGGSLLSVPILVYLFSLDVVIASSYSLFIVGTTSLIGAWLKQKDHRIDIRSGIIFSACSVIAIFSTRRWIVPAIPDEVLVYDDVALTKRVLILAVFALLAIASSLAILLKRGYNSHQDQPRLKLLAPVGFGTGILVGFVGAGGGFLILPTLSFFARLPFKIALGTTLLIIGMNSLLGFVGDVLNYEIDWSFLILITTLALTGMVIGNSYITRIPIQRLR